MDKKHIALKGTVFMPLHAGIRATISLGERSLLTSQVVAVYELSDERIVFETKNSIYSVTPDNAAMYSALIPTQEETAI